MPESPPAPDSAPSPIVIHPVPCSHLRTKKMFIPAQADEAFDEKALPGSDSFCWCNRSMTEIGPDDRLVNGPDCSKSSRICYCS